MLLGRISWLYFVILVVWLGQKASFAEYFELFRGHYDVFSNLHWPECSQTEGESVEFDQCSNWCQKYGANCEDMDCSYCICNRSDDGYTYIGHNDGDGRCERDEEVLPELVPTTSFRVRNRDRGLCITVDADSTNKVTAIKCNSFSLKAHWIWISTGKLRRLMNIKTFQCVEVANQISKGLRSITMKPCNLNSQKQTLSCNNDGRIWNRRKSKTDAYLTLPSSNVLSATIKTKGGRWYKYTYHYAKICTSPTIYKGCYRFADGSYLRFLSYDKQCSKQGGTCIHEEKISAPIFAQNAKCSLNWKESNYSRHGESWKSFKDKENYYFDLDTKKSVKLLKVNISASKKLNGSLIKLNITCKSKKNGRGTKEEHCVLLKFETLPGYDLEIKTSTIVPPTTKSSDAFTDATTIIKPSMKVTSSLTSPTLSSKSGYSTLKATKGHTTKATTITKLFPSMKVTSSPTSPTLSSKSGHSTLKATKGHTTKATTITKLFPSKIVTSSPTSTTPSSKSNFSNRSSSQSSNTVAISVPIVLLLVLACVAVGLFVIYRRRKGGQPGLTTNEEEMQSCQSSEAQNSSTNFYEDPTQMYEPLKVDKRGTGDEQPYQGLVGLNSQDKDTSVYDYIIDDKNATNAGAEGEYSYASNVNLPRSFAPPQPPPSAPVVYETLDEPDGLNNPAFDHDKLSDNKGHDPNEPFDEQSKNPVYQTLELEPEAVQNPKLKLNDESPDPVEESVEKQSPPNPVYQTLEEQEAVENPKSLDSVEESLEPQSPNPVYQTLENSNGGQDKSSETFGNSSPGDVPSGDPIYHVVDNP